MADRGASAAKTPWRGSGGRWLVWPMRIILWAAILIIGYRGVMAILLNETPASTNGAAPAPTSSTSPFPVTLGEAFALQFGQAYLNFTPAAADQRARELAAFIPANIAAVQPQFGWNGAGTLRLQSEQVAGIDVRDANNAVVTVLATVNGHLIALGVPVYASSAGALVVTAEPALLPPPSVATPPAAPTPSADAATQSALASQLPAFFQAYASGDQATLNHYLAPGVALTGLGGTVNYSSIASLTVPHGGATRDITVTVNWVLPGQVRTGVATLVQTYDMTVIDQQSGRWYVKEIRASTQPMGTQ
jgi:Conjugative transposon protein TcpC